MLYLWRMFLILFLNKLKEYIQEKELNYAQQWTNYYKIHTHPKRILVYYFSPFDNSIQMQTIFENDTNTLAR